MKNQVKEFNCRDKIFLYFTWFNLSGDYLLKAFWYKPKGNLQETTKYNFSVKNKKKFNSWLWLKLEKAKERGFILPVSGWSDFIGEWNVEFFLDGEFLENKKFRVIC